MRQKHLIVDLLAFLRLNNTRLTIYRVYSRFEPRTPQQKLALPSRGRLHDTTQTDSYAISAI